eukprot:c38808_g1_i1.p1 GENE.c38808_g1_i1~~c38808_g1_i1.p1  ORF type:complete len:581 (+),score=148.70 c38808_g1_i1:1-1743(+)
MGVQFENFTMHGVVFLVALLPAILAAPIESDQAVAAPEVASQNVAADSGLFVFDQNSAKTADQNKNYVIYAYDDSSCLGDKAAKCQELEKAFAEAVSQDKATHYLGKFRDHVIFGKANKNDFPAHKQQLEKAKVPLPAVLFWPAGHSRPSCKFDAPHPDSKAVADWLLAKIKDEEDDDFLELDEGAELTDSSDNSKIDETSLLVCQADGGPNLIPKEEPSCGDLMFTEQDLVQLEKTQKMWDAKEGKEVFAGPADNSLPKTVDRTPGVVNELDSVKYYEATKRGVWNAIYFYAPWCHHCSCLDPVWSSVSGNLVSSKRQPDLVLNKVNGDANVELRHLFNVTVYPTFLLVNKDGTKVLGRYLGPRKAFELSTWIEDLIVADENPILKKKFLKSEEGEHIDHSPVFPYSGESAYPAAVGAQALAVLSSELSGNDFDECLASDEAKFTAPGAALLVQHSADARSLEFDSTIVSVELVPDQLTVIDFYAPWCPHCQHLNPVWDTLSTQVEGVRIGKVDTDAHADVKRAFGIRRFPTIMYFEPGKKMTFNESHRYTGQRDVEHLKQWVNDLKAKYPSQTQTAKQ